MKTTKLANEPHCPKCAELLDGATSLRNASPKHGDFTICLYCQAVLQFTKTLGLKEIDIKTVPLNTQLQLRAYITAAKKL